MPECLDYGESSDANIWLPAQIMAWQWDTGVQRRRQREDGASATSHHVRAASIVPLAPGEAENVWTMAAIVRHARR